jgi:hypothetical protein
VEAVGTRGADGVGADGVSQANLTDNGKVFTGRFNQPPAEVLFDRICRENGIQHLLTQPRSPTTTGKIERFHRAIRTEFRTDRAIASLAAAQAELDEWVNDYNTQRPHQALDMATPAQRFWRENPAVEGDPAHKLGRYVVLRLAAGLPNSLIWFAPGSLGAVGL